MQKPDIILLTDHTDTIFLNKLLGPHKVAHELRRAGYHVVVINHLHIFTFEEICYLLEKLITEKTLYVGINNFWYKDIGNAIETEDGHVTFPTITKGCILQHGKIISQVISVQTSYRDTCHRRMSRVLFDDPRRGNLAIPTQEPHPVQRLS
jgi:hypothetical protein